ncbi:acyl-CoA dehydrogenase family protein [Stappia sp. F7233]|uniref:Acyl-CoA dehydrogenase family protein n=1 Tax=Stappia albiluteola TaxID=2758565 RepID=A0A839AB70_9HYPH|nr:acyl-CoA dehydrogenase family protein [Stappia albiluteola]MBA5776661.1 acyl-CoA dehydrogenase family protein [Stappia albiluteola]
MADKSFLSWPFFEDRHRDLAASLEHWAAENVAGLSDHGDVDASCRRLVAALGKAGFLRHAIPQAYGGASEALDVRSLCIIRETLARFDGLADFAFAMQGLGTGSISLAGSAELKARYLPPVGRGEKLAAFALSEPEAGSDVAALATQADPDGPNHVVLNGTKTWISNGGIADHYVVFARTGEATGARGLSAFVVDADTQGLTIAERIETIAPHPLATLSFENCRVPISHRLGNPGEGFKVAMATLDIFRSTVGAAALGFARAALDATLSHTTSRQLFGAPLADLQMTQASLADMVAEVDAAALLVYRAAWTKDRGAARVTREAALAKLVATENAQTVIDRAVQLHGGMGVTVGSKVEALYREIRALRIYEGASEIQKLVIARQAIADHVAKVG